MVDTPGTAPAQGVLNVEVWERPRPRLSGSAAAPVLTTDGFEGPLDWLLDLARTRRIDLARLSITDLVGAFEAALITALDAANKSPLLLARWGEWLVMAAELTLLRSRLLMPADTAQAQAAQDEAERLRRMLLRHAEIARVADWLEARPQLGQEVFLRGAPDKAGASRPERTGDVTALLRACLAAIRLPADTGAAYRVPEPPAWTVLDAITRIRTMLPMLDEAGGPLTRFLPPIPKDAPEREWRCRTAVSATFLAGLELTRGGAAELTQDEAWQDIQVSQS